MLWIELGGKPKWLPLNFGHHHDVQARLCFLMNWAYSASVKFFAYDRSRCTVHVFCCVHNIDKPA